MMNDGVLSDRGRTTVDARVKGGVANGAMEAIKVEGIRLGMP